MKTKLLRQIDFNAVCPMADQELNVIVGGSAGVKEVVIAVIDILTGGGDETNNNCGCNNCNCPS